MNISYASTFSQHKFVFFYTSRYSAVITMTLLLLQLLVSWGQGEIDARGMEFPKPS